MFGITGSACSGIGEYGVAENDIYFSSLLAAIIKNQEYDIIGSDLEKLLGRKPTDLKTY
jgi:NAD(P)H dehydrogenase (quinone)